ncbi:MAG: zf-HC2 domain-containing protein [Acidobacteria bacterium]|nr:zf-HC2 domain-containing protein [Acidobacteriota bacterium]
MSIDETLRQSLQPGPDCPAIEQLTAYDEGSLPAPELERVRKHCAECPACAAELSLFRQFAQAEVRPEEVADVEWMAERSRPAVKPPAPAKPRRSWWMMPAPAWALAGVALVMAGMGWQFNRGGLPQVAMEEGSSTLRSASVELLTTSGDLAEGPSEIAWKPVAGAASYQVAVLAVDGAELVKQQITGSQWDAQALRDLMRPRQTLMVRVTAQGPDGKQLAVSADVPFRRTNK